MESLLKLGLVGAGVWAVYRANLAFEAGVPWQLALNYPFASPLELQQIYQAMLVPAPGITFGVDAPFGSGSVTVPTSSTGQASAQFTFNRPLVMTTNLGPK